ncbi:MAG: D-tyrosyl-tRNA(Tyr) deacylase [bacterium]|nr:D-tyrosyl-tRNA(Tyr) deacylase [bacterium]
MKAVIQRVTGASVGISGKTVGAIGPGLLILLGIRAEDTNDDGVRLAKKIAELRIFNDDEKKMNLSLLESGGEALVVSQFTIHADCRKGRRPSFTRAATPDIAIPLYGLFIEELEAIGVKTASGEFGAMMEVELINDGPVTIIISSKNEFEYTRLD